MKGWDEETKKLHSEYREVAKRWDLEWYPCPRGDRYVYSVDGERTEKLSEHPDLAAGFFWALTRAEHLIVGKKA